MTVRMEVLSIKTCSDYIEVELQGKQVKAADWRPYLSWRIQVPVHIGKTYRIGQIVKMKVTR